MFNHHHINNRPKIRNLILLFLTIVLGFSTVLVLADLTIQTNIQNARQTIQKISVTSDGTDAGTLNMEISPTGMYLNPSILQGQLSFSGNILGLDAHGNIVYVDSQNLVISGAGDDGDRTITGNDIYRDTGNVAIGTNIIDTGSKVSIVDSAITELTLQETNPGNAANIHFTNTATTRTIGGYADRFYIGMPGYAYLNVTDNGYVGIGTTGPTAPLQVIGNFIAGENNSIVGASNSSIAGGGSNVISSNYAFIGGGEENTITGNSSYSSIPGGYNNSIEQAQYSLVGGRDAHARYNNSFVRNSVTSESFSSMKPGTFIINAPFNESREGGVGINTNNPLVALDVDGMIRTRTQVAGTDCDMTTAGAIRFEIATTHFRGCDGTSRKQLDN